MQQSRLAARVLQALADAVMETEVRQLLGRRPYERTGAVYRNGYRNRPWEFLPGEVITLRIPKLRCGGYFPTFLTSAKRFYPGNRERGEILIQTAHALAGGTTKQFDPEAIRHLMAQDLHLPIHGDVIEELRLTLRRLSTFTKE